ncbi:hypothetical protein LJC48_02405 [Desulfovibrio sp. OttesenSCG-928-C06]|nr:hypothetical protein [Desulfovibrio sp. OttesenSCG-928-C06]
MRDWLEKRLGRFSGFGILSGLMLRFYTKTSATASLQIRLVMGTPFCRAAFYEIPTNMIVFQAIKKPGQEDRALGAFMLCAIAAI